MSEWRDIPGYEGLYQVSDTGEVCRSANSPKCKTERAIRPQRGSNGYLAVSLSRDSKVHQIGIHRLVMWAFIGPQNSLWVNHKNGVKSDNRLANLEYLTPGQNIQHAYDTGLTKGPVGEKNGNAKLTEASVREILTLFRSRPKPKRADVEAQFGISKTALSDVLARRSWKEVE